MESLHVRLELEQAMEQHRKGKELPTRRESSILLAMGVLVGSVSLTLCQTALASDCVHLFMLPRTTSTVSASPTGLDQMRELVPVAGRAYSHGGEVGVGTPSGGPQAPLPDQLLGSWAQRGPRRGIATAGHFGEAEASGTRGRKGVKLGSPVVLCSAALSGAEFPAPPRTSGVAGVALVADDPSTETKTTDSPTDPGYEQNRAVQSRESQPGEEPSRLAPPVDDIGASEGVPRPPRRLPHLPELSTERALEEAPPAEDGPAAEVGACAACAGVSADELGSAPGPWKLIDGPCLRAWGISIGGWIEQGITFNAQEPDSRYNGPLATNDRHADYQLNQLWLYFVRPTNTGGCGFDIGGRLDIVFGSDWRYGIVYGKEDRINGLSQSYGLVLPQMYLEVAVNRLTVKLGHFAGILDYEAVPAILNPFYSHSYSYGYTVPILVTGMLASYQLTDQFGVDAGFHRGWMMFEDNNDNLDFMGGVRWKSLSGRTQVSYAVSIGPQDNAGEQDRFVYSLVLRQKMGQRIEYILVHNLGWENDAVQWAEPAPADAEWYGINQYFIYTISPKLSAALRVEWLRDDDGVRIAGVGNLVPGKGWSALPGFAGDFYELTMGLNWRPHPNCLLRPEVRWDWYDGSRNLQGQLPFDDGSSDHQLTCATDLIISY